MIKVGLYTFRRGCTAWSRDIARNGRRYQLPQFDSHFQYAALYALQLGLIRFHRPFTTSIDSSRACKIAESENHNEQRENFIHTHLP